MVDSLASRITVFSVNSPTTFKILVTVFVSHPGLCSGLLQPTTPSNVKLGGKVSGVKVPQMLCPHKLQPAGLEEVHPGIMRVRKRRRLRQTSAMFLLNYLREHY